MQLYPRQPLTFSNPTMQKEVIGDTAHEGGTAGTAMTDGMRFQVA